MMVSLGLRHNLAIISEVSVVLVTVLVTGARAQDDAGADLDLDSMAGPPSGESQSSEIEVLYLMSRRALFWGRRPARG